MVRKNMLETITHTNNLEGFWSQLKRSINGTYHFVSPNTCKVMSMSLLSGIITEIQTHTYSTIFWRTFYSFIN